MNVEYIDAKYKGTDIRVPLYFGLSTMAKYGDDIGLSVNELFALDINEMTLTQCMKLVKSTINGGFRQEEIPAEYSEIQIERIIDETPGLFQEIMAYTQRAQAEQSGNTEGKDEIESEGELMPAPPATETSSN